MNLYGFCGNDGINRTDILGCDGTGLPPGVTPANAAEYGYSQNASGTWFYNAGLVQNSYSGFGYLAKMGTYGNMPPQTMGANASMGNLVELGFQYDSNQAMAYSASLGQDGNNPASNGPGSTSSQNSSNPIANLINNIATTLAVAAGAPLNAINDAVGGGGITQLFTSPIDAALAIIGIGASALTGDIFDSYTPVTDGSTVFMNGVFTTSAAGQAMAAQLGDSYVNNNTHFGGAGDLLQAVFESLGIITTPGVYAAIDADNGTTTFNLFSQGAASGTNGLRLVPSGILSGITVNTYGGQVAAEANLLGLNSANNFVATGDPVPGLDPVNYVLRALGGGNTTTVNIPGSVQGPSFQNHSFVPNYQPYVPIF